jgi:hypothetical protein
MTSSVILLRRQEEIRRSSPLIGLSSHSVSNRKRTKERERESNGPIYSVSSSNNPSHSFASELCALHSIEQRNELIEHENVIVRKSPSRIGKYREEILHCFIVEHSSDQHRQLSLGSTRLGRIGTETIETHQADSCQTSHECFHGLGSSCSKESH